MWLKTGCSWKYLPITNSKGDTNSLFGTFLLLIHLYYEGLNEFMVLYSDLIH